MNKSKTRFSFMTCIIFIVLITYTLLLVFPLLWGLMSSFKDSWDFIDFPLKFPKEWLWSNYLEAFKSFSAEVATEAGFRTAYLPEMFVNTIIYTGGAAIMVTIMPCLTAYIVCKFQRKFKVLNVYYVIVVVCMSLPLVGTLPSEIQMARSLHIFGTMWGLIMMKGYFLGMYFLVFFATFKTIPDTFSEAAKIDGAGNFKILFSIMFPLVKNTFFTVLLIQFVAFWNDYQTPLIYLPDNPTAAMGLYYFSTSTDSEKSLPPMQLTGCMLLFVPIFTIFIIFRNRFMTNVSLGGVKE